MIKLRIRRLIAAALSVGLIVSSVPAAVYAEEMEDNSAEGVVEDSFAEEISEDNSAEEISEDSSVEEEVENNSVEEVSEEPENSEGNAETQTDIPEGGADEETEDLVESDLPDMGESSDAEEEVWEEESGVLEDGASEYVEDVNGADFGSEEQVDVLNVPDEPQQIGSSGTYWTFDENGGVLTISGSGPMALENEGDQWPWDDGDYQYVESWREHPIQSVVIGSGITEIGDGAFSGCDALTSLTINGNNLTTIGQAAFYCCDHLPKVTLPNSVTTIGLGAFRSCSSITSLALPSSLNSIGESAFEDSGLTDINIPSTVETIPERTFAKCAALKNVQLNQGVKSIGKEAFSECKALEEIELPSGLTSIGERAFYDCTKLYEVTIEEKNISFGKGAFSFYSTWGEKFRHIYYAGSKEKWKERLANYKEDKNDRLLTADVHYNGSDRTDITNERYVTFYLNESERRYAYTGAAITPNFIARYLKDEGSNSYSDLKQGEDYTVSPEIKNEGKYNLTITGKGAFEGSLKYPYPVEVVVPATNGKAGKKVNWVFKDGTLTLSGTGPMYDFDDSDTAGPGWRDLGSQITKIVVEKGVTTIGANTFGGLSKLTTVSLPEGITKIGKNAFAWCEKLTTINFPSTLTSIEMLAFCECTRIKTIEIPSGVKTITHGSFQSARMTKLVIPLSVTKIERGAFMNNGGITTIYYEGNQAKWNNLLKSTYEENETITKPKKVIYNAAVSITVTFKGGTPETLRVEQGKTIGSANKNKLPTAKKKGSVFNGWYTKSSGGTKIAASTKVTKAATYYPHWTKVSVGKPSVKKLTGKSKGFTVTWSKVAGVKGYEIRYCGKSNMKGYKTKSAKASKTSLTVSGLSKKKKYYVQVAADKSDSTNAKVYSTSAKKPVTTK